MGSLSFFCFFFQAEDGIRDPLVTGVQTCALPILGALDDATARADIRKRLALVPGDWPVRSIYESYLLKKNAYEEARRVTQDWLAHNPRVPGLQPIEATTLMARTFYLQHDYAQAWKLLEPVVSSQY